MESPSSQQHATHQHHHQQQHDVDIATRRQNGTLSSSYFSRPVHPFLVDAAAAVAGASSQQRPSRPRSIRDTSLDEVLGPHDQLEQQFHRTLLRVERMMRSNDTRAAERDRQTTLRAEWQLVATVVDRILLVIFVVTTVGVTKCSNVADVLSSLTGQQRHCTDHSVTRSWSPLSAPRPTQSASQRPHLSFYIHTENNRQSLLTTFYCPLGH